MKVLTAIGLMSGTSMDGIDAAILCTDGERIESFGPAAGRPFSDYERGLIRRAMAAAIGLNERTARPGVIGEAERLVTDAHEKAVRQLLDNAGLRPADIDVIGFHGQTLLHRPDAAMTVQIGEGQRLADRLGVPVVHDFRAADMAAGGEGAPLVPVFHRALAQRAELVPPVAVLNVGGVANVTWIGEGGELIACDVGPGNALLDDFMLERTGDPLDRDGQAAAHGTPDEAVLAQLLTHPFFERPPPKSLDRNAFSRKPVTALGIEDGAATLTAFSAQAAARIVSRLPAAPQQWIVCGGGARNPTFLRMLAQAAGAPVVSAEALGWSADMIEAQAFGYLAVRSLYGLPLTFPGTTGVAAPACGGVISRPREAARTA